jgi:hypothetical protein
VRDLVVTKFPNHLLVSLIIISAAAATTPLAAKVEKPVTEWTCADLLLVDDQLKPKVVYWAVA